MIRLWNESQIMLLEQVNSLLGDKKIPPEVIAAAKDTIQILDQNYGSQRHPDKDLGGSLYILETGTINDCEDYKKLLVDYKTTSDMAEFTDEIIVSEKEIQKIEIQYQWYLQSYVLSSDYTLTVIYKEIVL